MKRKGSLSLTRMLRRINYKRPAQTIQVSMLRHCTPGGLCQGGAHGTFKQTHTYVSGHFLPAGAGPTPSHITRHRDVFLGSEAERASPWKSHCGELSRPFCLHSGSFDLFAQDLKAAPRLSLMHISSLAKSRKAATTSLPLLLHLGPAGHCHARSGHGNSPGLLPPVPHCPPRSRAGVPFKALSFHVG